MSIVQITALHWLPLVADRDDRGGRVHCKDVVRVLIYF